MSTSIVSTGALVQQVVICATGADYEIAAAIIGTVLVDMMNFSAFWQTVPKRTFSDNDMLVGSGFIAQRLSDHHISRDHVRLSANVTPF
jgi:hypothetical protein